MAVGYTMRGNMRTIVVPRCDFTRPYYALLGQLCEAQNWRCCYCGIDMDIGPFGDRAASVEHVMPKVAGGKNVWGNLAAACKLCNNGRSAMKYEKYLRFVVWKGRERAAQYGHKIRGKVQRREFQAKLAALANEQSPRPTEESK